MIACALLFLIILFIYPQEALNGSKYGATLWLTELLPTLLPFFIGIRLFQQSLPKIATRRASLLLGILCGYPTGATLVSFQYQQGLLSSRQAYFFLGFVNNPSPMFILSFCGAYILHLSYFHSLILFFILLVSSFLGSICFSFATKKISSTGKKTSSVQSSTEHSCSGSLSKCIDDIILQSFILITKIGGYVILFSILGSVVGKYISLNHVSGITITGLLEITSGLSYLKHASCLHTTKIVLTSMLLCFGGFSSVAQTSSALSASGLSIFPYVINKLLNALFAGVGTLLLLHFV